MGSGAPSCWGGSLGIQPEWPVPGRFPTPSATFPQSHMGRGRKPTHIRLRFSPPGEDLGGLVNRGSLAELPSPREAGARRCWIPVLSVHSGGPWVPVGGARLWEPQLRHTFSSSGHDRSGAAPQTSTPLLHCREENDASSLYWSLGPPLLESTHLFPPLL